MNPEDKSRLPCQHCEKSFKSKKTYYPHLRKAHQLEPDVNSFSNIKCPHSSCEKCFFRRDQLRSHLSESHGVNIELVEETFQTFEDFRLWKESIQKEEKCLYVKNQSGKTLASHDKVYYFICDRSGSFVSEGTGQRRMKRMGSKKIDCFCPSSMEVLISANNGRVRIKFYKTHYGHDVYFKHLKLSDEEKTGLAQFEAWKDDVERKSHCKYSRQKAATASVTGEKVLHFDCHRCKSKGIRRTKRTGSVKINKTCPSSMVVSYTEDKVNVTFRKTHYGHQNDIAHLFLSKNDRLEITDSDEEYKGSDVPTDDKQSSGKQGGEKALEDYTKLLSSGEYSDVTLQVGDVEFQAHRNILSVRSPVLSAALRQMDEGSIMRVDDFDPDAFGQYLHYLYTGSVQSLSRENVFSLHHIADMYLADDLKQVCLEHIGKELSVRTFCDTIRLAVRHSESDLLQLAMDFATRHLPQIIRSAKWQDFISDYPKEANEILVKCIKQ